MQAHLYTRSRYIGCVFVPVVPKTGQELVCQGLRYRVEGLKAPGFLNLDVWVHQVQKL